MATEKSADEKSRATLDQLKKKQRKTKNLALHVLDDDGEPVEVEMVFQAISGYEFDQLKKDCKPTQEDKKAGLDYNAEKFAPKLIAATCIEPAMSEDDAQEIWDSDEWNRGERMQLFMAAMEVCTSGLNVPFKSSG